MKPDPKQPYNNLKFIPPKIDLKDQDLLMKTIVVSEKISQLETLLTYKSNTLANAIDLLSPLFIPEAVSSSGVENIVTTNESVYIAKITEERNLKPAEKEALNYTSAVTKGLSKIAERGFLTTNDYVDLQKIIEPDKAGVRKIPGTQLKNPITGMVYYTPPVGEALIRRLLGNFEKYFNEDAPKHEIFSRMAILHYQFEAIHPFKDGNGRTGRMLMPLYLTKQKRLSFPILFISRYILENRDEYYKRLRDVTYKEDWKGWIEYILDATIEQAEYTCKILEKIHIASENVREKLRKKLPKIYSSELVDFIFSNVFFTRKMFEENLGVSPGTARTYLHELEREGTITKRKQINKNRYLYIAPEYLRILRRV